MVDEPDWTRTSLRMHPYGSQVVQILLVCLIPQKIIHLFILIQKKISCQFVVHFQPHIDLKKIIQTFLPRVELPLKVLSRGVKNPYLKSRNDKIYQSNLQKKKSKRSVTWILRVVSPFNFVTYNVDKFKKIKLIQKKILFFTFIPR